MYQSLKATQRIHDAVSDAVEPGKERRDDPMFEGELSRKGKNADEGGKLCAVLFHPCERIGTCINNQAELSSAGKTLGFA